MASQLPVGPLDQFILFGREGEPCHQLKLTLSQGTASLRNPTTRSTDLRLPLPYKMVWLGIPGFFNAKILLAYMLKLDVINRGFG